MRLERVCTGRVGSVDQRSQLTDQPVAESYITHIRITEDAQYPQTPHPPDSPSANKERMIVVSVRNTGRVRMHKARENGNHTFSIGKTWALEDLSAIQSWAFYTARSPEESQQKVWAGDIGFTVTLAKPYYWQAGTAKEKEFFIASLVKIYRKYTQGKVPELVGFPPAELQAMIGGQQQQQPQQQQQQQTRGPPSAGAPPPFSPGRNRGPSFGGGSPRGVDRQPLSSPDSFSGPQTPDGIMNQTLPPPRNRATPTSNPQNPYQPRPGTAQSQTASSGSSYVPPDPRQLRARPSRDADLRQAPSREQLRPLRSMGPDRLTPQSSQSSFRREGTPDSLNMGGSRQTAGSTPERRSPSQNRGESDRGEDSAGPNGLGIVNPSSDRWRSNGATPPGRRDETARPLRTPNGFDAPAPLSNGSRSVAEEPPITALPERRRPPMTGPLSNGSQASLKSPGDQLTSPPATSNSRRGGLISPAAASSESLLGKKMPGGFTPSPAPSDQLERDGLLPAPLQLSPKPRPAEPVKSMPEAVKTEPEPSPEVKPPAEKTEEEIKEQERKDAEEAARPGLGRMFGGNKKTARDLFKSAANAYGAFVPRAGGAGAKVLGGPVAVKPANEPDGISGVVPAPGMLRTKTDDSMRSEQTQGSIQATPTSAKAAPSDSLPDPIPQVTVSSPISPLENEKEMSKDVAPEETSKSAVANVQQKKAKLAEEEAARRKKRRSAQQTKYLSMLGIDAAVIDNRGLEFESMLDDFGWGTSVFHSKSIDVLETDIRREISRVEAGSWLGHLEQKDDRVEAVEMLLDKAITECDELEGLLTLYSVELSVSRPSLLSICCQSCAFEFLPILALCSSACRNANSYVQSLNEDIAFIEAQSQGLQVQTANQKLLQTELSSLVTTISITSRQLEPLKRITLGSTDGLEMIEHVLLMLYKAMIAIDPSIRQGGTAATRSAALANGDLSSMTALQEKSDQYLGEASIFLNRLKKHLEIHFAAAFMNTTDYIKSNGLSSSTKLSVEAHDLARNTLWMFGPEMLFAKEIDGPAWDSMMRTYQKEARAVYKPEMRDNLQAWLKAARKSTGDEQELLFTYGEKETDGLGVTAARKMTVKRSQTLAKGLRSASGEKSRAANMQSGTLFPFEAFASALDEVLTLIFTEQNFIVDFFCATGNQKMDFADAVAQDSPEKRRGTNLYGRKPTEPDKVMARRVAESMSDIFSSFPNELNSLMLWCLSTDPLQGIGVMHALHRAIASFEDTNQDFIVKTLTTLADQLKLLWNKTVEEQIRAIEDTKVKIKKRKGVITFIKIFPNFSAAIENMLPSSADEPPESSEVRSMIDKAYQRIHKAMFESLRVIAKESPAMMVGGAVQPLANDPEDKEALNYHILLIENMNHYVEEVDDQGDRVLAEGKIEAREEMTEHLNMYVDAVIRRPLGKVVVSFPRQILSLGCN
jgi:hypothetical protein